MEDWEKELRKKKRFDDLIINRPEAMTKIRRGTEISITTIGWIVWIFICRPLLIVFLWMLGFRFFFEHMVVLGGLGGLFKLWPIYGSIIIIIMLIVRGWNVYNKRKYGPKNRRKSSPPVSSQELQEFFKLPDGAPQRIQQFKQVDVDFHEDHALFVKGTKEDQEPISAYFQPR